MKHSQTAILLIIFLTLRNVSGAAKAGEPCMVDSDCATPYEFCEIKEDNPVCTHKSLFPMLTSEWYGLFIVMFLLAFTNTGGLGGAGIIIPLMLGGMY